MAETVAKSKTFGVDVGTMFFQTAEMDDKNNISFKTIRNAFVELPKNEDTEDVLKNNNWKWVKDDQKFYVIGEDSLKVANMFPNTQLRRPLQDGVLNKCEEKKMVVLAEIIESTIGKAPDPKSVVCTCISSPSVDGSQDSTFHKVRLQGMFKRLGWQTKVIEEGLAVVLSERPTMVESDGTESPYSGIGISFGAGRVNAVLAYKGLQVMGMSASRSGDWIDKKSAEATDTPLSAITRVKETKLDLAKPNLDDEKIYALYTYYQSAIEYTLQNFAKKFMEVKSQFESPLEIVIAGGTSSPKGFCPLVGEVIKGLSLPFQVKNVRHATDPRNAVVKGCLTQALITSKKLAKATDSEDLKEILGE